MSVSGESRDTMLSQYVEQVIMKNIPRQEETKHSTTQAGEHLQLHYEHTDRKKFHTRRTKNKPKTEGDKLLYDLKHDNNRTTKRRYAQHLQAAELLDYHPQN